MGAHNSHEEPDPVTLLNLTCMAFLSPSESQILISSHPVREWTPEIQTHPCIVHPPPSIPLPQGAGEWARFAFFCFLVCLVFFVLGMCARVDALRDQGRNFLLRKLWELPADKWHEEVEHLYRTHVRSKLQYRKGRAMNSKLRFLDGTVSDDGHGINNRERLITVKEDTSMAPIIDLDVEERGTDQSQSKTRTRARSQNPRPNVNPPVPMVRVARPRETEREQIDEVPNADIGRRRAQHELEREMEARLHGRRKRERADRERAEGSGGSVQAGAGTQIGGNVGGGQVESATAASTSTSTSTSQEEQRIRRSTDTDEVPPRYVKHQWNDLV